MNGVRRWAATYRTAARADEHFTVPSLEVRPVPDARRDVRSAPRRAYVRFLTQVLGVTKITARAVVPIPVDESRNFRDGGMFRQVGIYTSRASSTPRSTRTR